MSTLPRLPLDCLIHILAQLPPSRSQDGDISVKTLAKCAQVDSTFRQATLGAPLWEPHYRARYRHYDEANEAKRKGIYGDEYRQLYAERRKLDRVALSLMDKIVEDRRVRTECATEIVRLRLDILDALQSEAQNLEGPLPILSCGAIPKPETTRYFWVKAIMEEITRGYGVRLWGRIVRNEISYVEGYLSMSCFFGKTYYEVRLYMDPSTQSSRRRMQVKTILDDITIRARDYLLQNGVTLSKEAKDYDAKAVCLKICEFMRDEGFGPVDARLFHSIQHQFPHAYLTTNRKANPISLVHVFVAIAHFVGVIASPVDFPVRVLAHVAEPREDVDDFFVNVYDSQILSLRDDIPHLLSRQGVSPARTEDFITPCGPIPMILRAGRNIMAALHSPGNASASLARAAIIFTFSMHIQLSDRSDLVPPFIAGCEALDCATFVSEEMIPEHPEGSTTRELLASGVKETMEREKAEAEVIHYRSQEETSIQHFVGMVFQHRAYHYIGCIFGWDPVCAASEDWIREMNVKSLPRGRYQPFYQSFCNDGSIRYVAEDNVTSLPDPEEEVFINFHRKIGVLPRYFSGVHMRRAGNSSRGRFFPSPEILRTYPEDDDIGRAWVEQIEPS
ncbi:hypothetical protein V5O48_002562 [Marasmius crinis-equi]|uniref:Hemimethylated DNA-binding domain-containing protein n=1 Tax=Marasmius crinis-equi TaxID=585013 RepID=A0ABR3FVB5_9AGAR